jgi:NAD(P)-dependent dehydrogenase (short-subunit alcohol dehydrogenase family)
MRKQLKLIDKVIVITGSTRGIGRAVAEACAEEGAKVVLNSRSEEELEEVCESFREREIRVSSQKADVSCEKELKQLFQHAINTWGRIDVWINNAGLSGGYRYIQDLSSEEIEAIIDVNLKGTLLACKMLLHYFCQNNSGILINLSGRGSKFEAAPYLTTYAATKAAISSLTRSLAREVKDKPISIHSVIPGMVDTDFYRDVPTSSRLEKEMKNIHYILNAFGIPVDVVGHSIAKIASQKPGKSTGKQYSLLSGRRMVRGIGLILWYRLTGRLK